MITSYYHGKTERKTQLRKKKMSKKSWQGGSIRTTITLNRRLWNQTRKLMDRHGYGDNFSAFIADCVRTKVRVLERREK